MALGTAATAITPRLSSVLDLSRWVAAGLVMVVHVRENVLTERDLVPSYAEDIHTRIIYLVTDCGAQAVMWFFVLSGFLVGGNVLIEIGRGSFTFRKYLLDRASRLYVVLLPAVLVGYSLDLLRVAMYGVAEDAAETRNESAASYGFWIVLANLLCAQTIVAPTLGSNKVLWSLAFEAWYYVLFPLLMAPFMTTRPVLSRALLFGTGLLIAVFLSLNPWLLKMFVIWGLGAAIRFCPGPLVRARPIAWAIAVAAFVVFPVLATKIGNYALLVVALTFANALLAEARAKDAPSLRFSKAHAALAGFSFSLFLVHAPALHFILAVINDSADPRLHLHPDGWGPVAWAVGLFAVLVTYAWAFGRLTEAHTGRVRVLLARFLSAPAALPAR